MKRTSILVSVFSIVCIVIISLMSTLTIKIEQPIIVHIDDIDATLEYEIDFDYRKLHPNQKPYININIVGKRIYFKQVYKVPLYTNSSTFRLGGSGNNSVIDILEIYEPIWGSCRTFMPILITGVLHDITQVTFTLQFVSIKDYVNETNIIESFSICL